LREAKLIFLVLLFLNGCSSWSPFHPFGPEKTDTFFCFRPNKSNSLNGEYTNEDTVCEARSTILKF
jgi:hypothetical protein